MCNINNLCIATFSPARSCFRVGLPCEDIFKVVLSTRGFHVALCSAHVGLSDASNRRGGIRRGLLVTLRSTKAVYLCRDSVLTIWLASQVRQAAAGL